MAGLTVREKEHWKDRIARRINRRLEALAATEPTLLERIGRAARQRAAESLGLGKLQTQLDEINRQKEDLDRQEQAAHRAMLAIVRRVPVEELNENTFGPSYEVGEAIQRRQAIHEEELLAEDALGQQILALRREKDNLLDTVWLATSPSEVRELWQKVSAFLGEEGSPLQQEALQIGTAKASSGTDSAGPQFGTG